MRHFRAPLVHTPLLLASLVLACACNLDNLGEPPPVGDIYLPTALGLSVQTADSPPRYMFLVNSNFDLRYNGGSIQAYDLDKLDAELAKCAQPGESCVVPTSGVLADEVLASSLATSLGFSPSQDRLYVATRTDSRLLFVDVNPSAERDEDVLQCSESDRRCSDDHVRGVDADENKRRLRLPPEPVGLVSFPAASVYGQGDGSLDGMDYVLLAHRSGQVSLFFDDGANGPKLIDVRSGLPLEPTGIAFDPMTKLAYLSVFARNTTTLQNKILARVGISPEPDMTDAFIYDPGYLNIDGVAWQRDTRAVAINPARPGQALVLSNQPSALLWSDIAGNLTGSLPPGSAPARTTLQLGGGPSRIALGQLAERSIAAVSCFDSHEVFIVDTNRAELLAVVHNLNGPFELAIDAARKRLYVADFRASVVRVMDLGYVAEAGAVDRTDVPVIGMLGAPKHLQELQ